MPTTYEVGHFLFFVGKETEAQKRWSDAPVATELVIIEALSQNPGNRAQASWRRREPTLVFPALGSETAN